MDLTNVTASKITFKQQLSCTRFSVIFLAVIRNQEYVMKCIMAVGPSNTMSPPIGKQTSTSANLLHTGA
ncbi:hypothetical protein VTN77DRAFT_9265 [Rasamsonia byssochlamydoides]|uniref:uncharacterized protein n=1 Tax=Rasamsonia byssochlamydoides TaxID=89139 RepID=UPI00374214AB